MANDIIRESSMSDQWNVWFSELHRNRVGLSIKIKRLLYSGESSFQRIDVLDTYEFGRMLVLYGSIMVTEKDEFVYHEMISHVPLFTHPDPREVLIIGGGDGGTLREVLRHKDVEKAFLVEIDEMVVKTSQQFLPTIATDFDNPRAHIIFEDGAKFLARDGYYDLIIIDSADPIGPAEVLFQREFHQKAFDRLKDDGILIAQTESPMCHRDTIKKIYRNLKSIFPIVRMYLAYVPTYPGVLWSFAFCSKKYDPIKDFRAEKFKSLSLKTSYYNPEIHNASFCLPNFVRELV